MITSTTSEEQEIADFRNFLARIPVLRNEMERIRTEHRDTVTRLAKHVETQTDVELRKVMEKSLQSAIQFAEYIDTCLGDRP